MANKKDDGSNPKGHVYPTLTLHNALNSSAIKLCEILC